MTRVKLTNVDVRIPIYDAHGLRLFKVPSFKRSKVGTNTASASGSTIIMHALKNLSLELAEGDRVCLIGHNGAGKTTLLRLVAGIYPPSSGSIEVNGKVSTLLGGSRALVVDATGYENIRLVASLHDWPPEEFDDHVRDIEEFTELGDYLSLPARVYSAGMNSRLAFALATTLAPDILLIDEGIGAGDAHFQKRAQERIKQFVSRARVMLLASHSRELCRALCNKALVLSQGQAMFFGGIDEGFKVYDGMK